MFDVNLGTFLQVSQKKKEKERERDTWVWHFPAFRGQTRCNMTPENLLYLMLDLHWLGPLSVFLLLYLFHTSHTYQPEVPKEDTILNKIFV